MKLKLSCLFLFIAIFFKINVSAQPEMDATFNATGKKLLQFASLSTAEDVAVQPDNKIVMVGGCNHISFGFFPICLVRLNEDGSYDNTFGSNNFGYALTNIPGGNGTGGGEEIALQSDGKIVVAGWTGYWNEETTFVARYNANGTLDTSFGTDGFVKTVVNGSSRPREAIIQPDGKIVIVGFCGNSTNQRQFVARYLPNGALDDSFGQAGIVRVDTAGNNAAGSSIGLQADGKIVTGGSVWTPAGAPVPSGSLLLTRLNADGSLDASFDEDGFKTIVFGTSSAFFNGIVALAVQADARILAVTFTNLLYRFNADGSLDTSFDEDGSRVALTGTATPYDLTVSTSGKITVVGVPAYNGSNYLELQFRVSRYLPNGAPDTSFSDDGFLNIEVAASRQDAAHAAALDSFGRSVVTGFSATGVGPNPWEWGQMSIVRLVAPRVQSVGFSGRVSDTDGRAVASASVTLTDAAGTTYTGRTNPFGYFRLTNVPTAQTYTLSARAKGLNFHDRRVLVDDTVTNFLIVGAQ
jgi:uncharacterized delta-60 repeat protein